MSKFKNLSTVEKLMDGFNPHRQRQEETRGLIKKWEPTVPLLSRGSEPLKLDHLATDESKHEEFVTWLHTRQLFSTLTLRRHCPFWHDARGWTEKRMAVSVDREVTEIDGIEIEVTTTKPRLSEI